MKHVKYIPHTMALILGASAIDQSTIRTAHEVQAGTIPTVHDLLHVLQLLQVLLTLRDGVPEKGCRDVVLLHVHLRMHTSRCGTPCAAAVWFALVPFISDPEVVVDLYQ